MYGSRVLNKNRYNINGFISNFRIFRSRSDYFELLNNQNRQMLILVTRYLEKIFLKLNPQENDFAFCPE